MRTHTRAPSKSSKPPSSHSSMRASPRSAWAALLLTLLAALIAGCAAADDPADRYDYGRPGRERLPKMTMLNHQKVMGDLLGEPAIPVKTIGILVYDGVDTLEAMAPMVVFSELMDVKLEYVGRHAGRVKTRLAEMEVEHSIDDIDALDLLVVPGGDRAALEAVLGDADTMAWVKRIDAKTRLTAGIGYGTAILGKAGLLKQKRIAFDWPDAQANATALGAIHAPGRYAHDGKYWTAQRSSAALDVSLAMLQAIAGTHHLQAAMLDLEYDPAPPFVGGTPDTTPPELVQAQSARGYRLGELSLLDLPGDTASASAAPTLDIGILVYQDFFTLDAIGPLAAWSQVDGVRVRLLRYGEDEPIKSGRTYLRVPLAAADADRLDVLVVPGGSNGTWDMTLDPQALAWIRGMDQKTRYTASVCTGSWILGAADLLRGRKAATNWYRARDMMALYGATRLPARYTSDGKYWTSAGVSAGIDLSFAMIADAKGEAAAREAMLRLNYRPEPPIDAGSPEKTDDLVLDMMHQMYDYVMLPLIKKERERRKTAASDGKSD